MTTARPARDDRGIAAVWSVGLVGVLLITALAATALALVVVARMKAMTVADLASLTAARDGSCASAEHVAVANGMAVHLCRWEGSDVVVTVQAPAPPQLERMTAVWGGSPPWITAQSRAGFP